MDKLIFALGIIFAVIIFLIASFIGFFWALYALAEEPVKEYITISENEYTVSHEFGMTAGVEPNECNTCIKYKRPSLCLEACKDVLIIE